MKKLIISGIISLVAASALMAQEGDIVFVIDESGSMTDHIGTVIANVENLVDALEDANVDYQLGLVGFGSGRKGNPRVVTQLTDDSTTFEDGLQELLPVYGGYEPGFSAVSLGLSTAMEPEAFRPDAGTCVIMLTDEQAELNDQPNKAAALTALGDKDAIYYGIVNLSGRVGYVGTTANDYGPNPGSLSEVTGGSVWDIADLGTFGEEIIAQVMEKCISEAIIPEIEVDFDVHPQSCPNPLNVKSKGVVPMAILGREDFDVADINISSIQINGVSPVNYAYEDVAEPFTGEVGEDIDKKACWEYESIDEVEYAGDGYTDLTLKFKMRDLVAAGLAKGVQYLDINGTTNDGTPIYGTDVVWVK